MLIDSPPPCNHGRGFPPVIALFVSRKKIGFPAGYAPKNSPPSPPCACLLGRGACLPPLWAQVGRRPQSRYISRGGRSPGTKRIAALVTELRACTSPTRTSTEQRRAAQQAERGKRSAILAAGRRSAWPPAQTHVQKFVDRPHRGDPVPRGLFMSLRQLRFPGGKASRPASRLSSLRLVASLK
jgi:hypothetical protein